MTWGNPPKFNPKNEPKAGKLIRPEDIAGESEDSQQEALMCWAALSVGKYPDLKWLHSIPNGGFRNKISAGKMVATGARSGVWDVFLPCPIQTEWANMYAGCYIEMKREKYRNHKDGGLTKEQVEFRDYIIAMSYYCRVCYNWEEARDVLVKYLEGRV